MVIRLKLVTQTENRTGISKRIICNIDHIFYFANSLLQENIIFVSKPISNHNLKNRIQTLPPDYVTEQVRIIVSLFRFLPFGVRVCDITIHRRSVLHALGTELSRRVVLSLTTGRNQNGADSSLADFISHARQQVASSDDVNRVSLLGYTIASYQA